MREVVSNPLIVQLKQKPTGSLIAAQTFLLTAWNYAHYGISCPSADGTEAKEGYRPNLIIGMANCSIREYRAFYQNNND